jgi:N-acetylmuramoyl-L-alanine amidase
MLSGCLWSWLAALTLTLPAPVRALAAEDPPTYPRRKPAPADLDIACRTVFGEARGESWRGKLAVAYVIVNRANIAKAYRERSGKEHAMFGDGTLAGACMMPWQFSVWSRTDPNFQRLSRASTQPGWDECVDAVLTAVSGREKDPSNGATHYHSRSARPVWSRGKASVVIGNHRFLRLMD